MNLLLFPGPPSLYHFLNQRTNISEHMLSMELIICLSGLTTMAGRRRSANNRNDRMSGQRLEPEATSYNWSCLGHRTCLSLFRTDAELADGGFEEVILGSILEQCVLQGVLANLRNTRTITFNYIIHSRLSTN